MTVVKQSPRLTYDVNLHGFVLAPGLAGEFRGAVLLDDDNYETMPVVATYDWFWGLHCELEASDYQDCENFCGGLNASVESVDTAIKDGACLALCTCVTGSGAELGPVIGDTDAP